MDNTKKDELYKVRSLIESMNWKFQDIRAFEEYVSVGESMVCFKRGCSFKEYIQ